MGLRFELMMANLLSRAERYTDISSYRGIKFIITLQYSTPSIPNIIVTSWATSRHHPAHKLCNLAHAVYVILCNISRNRVSRHCRTSAHSSMSATEQYCSVADIELCADVRQCLLTRFLLILHNMTYTACARLHNLWAGWCLDVAHEVTIIFGIEGVEYCNVIMNFIPR